MSSLKFKTPFGQKIWIHLMLKLSLPRGTIFNVLDTKYNHSKTMLEKQFDVRQFGYDFGTLSTDHLRTLWAEIKSLRAEASGGNKELKKQLLRLKKQLIWLDYCQTPKASFVPDDLELCKKCGMKLVFCTFAIRGCINWKYKIRHLGKKAGYKVGWVYQYHDTSSMILVAFYKGNKKPTKIINPVGKIYKFKDLNGNTYMRRCQKVLVGPKNDRGPKNNPVLYLKFHDSNEPVVNCKKV